MLESWENLKENFKDGLLLGNGASIAIHSEFRYSSLLDVARKANLITNRIDNLFTSFTTDDFELVLEVISHARTVNTVLEIQDTLTERTYEDLRLALLGSIQSVHPTHDQVEPHLPAMIGFMKQFRTIFSLNYDLVLYWAMLRAKATLGNWFKDCFIESSFRYGNWRELRTPYGATGTTLVFYPHGSLAVAMDSKRSEYKVVKDENKDLLETIADAWTNGASPVFVSEGESKQKVAAIRRSTYLSTIFDSTLGEVKRLVVYGWSMNDNDSHILGRLCSGLEAMAVSIHTSGKTPREIRARCTDCLSKIQRYSDKIDVHFFSAQDSGAWIYV